MSKEPEPELMIAAYSFVSDRPYPLEVKRGLTLLSDDVIVTTHPKAFVPQSAGAQALGARANEMERAMEQLREKQREELRQARIRQGTKFDPSDDAVAESVKRRVRSDDELELVHDALTGIVIGARLKPEVLERARQRAEKAERDGTNAIAQQAAALQAAREA
jgi:hypothetical protein